MGWGALVGAAIDWYAGNEANKGNKDATKAGVAGQQQYIDELKRQFDVNQQNQAPWLDAGKWSLPQLMASFKGDMSGFFNSPDYLAAQKQGLTTLDNSAASRGGLFGGGHTRDTIKYGQDLASQFLGNYRSGLGTIAGFGQNSANTLGQYGQNYANSLGGAYQNIGSLRGDQARNSAYNNANQYSNLGSSFNKWYQDNQFGGV